jgi:hypothetical protein
MLGRTSSLDRISRYVDEGLVLLGNSRFKTLLQSQISKLAQDSTEPAKGQASPVPEANPSPVPPHFPRADNGAPRYAIKVTEEDRGTKPKRRPTSPYAVQSEGLLRVLPCTVLGPKSSRQKISPRMTSRCMMQCFNIRVLRYHLWTLRWRNSCLCCKII